MVELNQFLGKKVVMYILGRATNVGKTLYLSNYYFIVDLMNYLIHL